MLWMILENFLIRLWNVSFQTAVIFCVLFLVRILFDFCRVPKKYTCFLWLILFIRLLMPVQPESPVGLWTKDSVRLFLVEKSSDLSGSVTGTGDNIFVSEKQDGTENIYVRGEMYGSENIHAQGGTYGSENFCTPKEQHAEGMIYDSIYIPARYLPVICIVWAAGCLGLLFYGGVSYLLLKKKLRCSIKGEGNCHLVDGIPTAFVMGIFLPEIYLPSELEGEDLTYVVLHERMHVKRKDHMIKLAACLIACFYWFHPLVWAALIFMGKDIEMACDEAVLRELGEGSRRAYAGTLLRLSSSQHYFAGIPLAFGEGDTEKRIRHIAGYRRPAAVVAVVGLAMTVGLTVSLLTGRAGTLNDVEQEDGQTGFLSDVEQEDSQYPFPVPVELPSGHTVNLEGDVYEITVIIDGEAYRMAELCDAVNAVMGIRELGEYVVIEGHISPDNAYYGFYSTESKQWEWEYIGSLLTWDENWEALENPMESVIYAESSDSRGVIRNWEMNEIAVFNLEEEYIYGLKRAGDEITITIVNYAAESRELSFDYKDSSYILYYW